MQMAHQRMLIAQKWWASDTGWSYGIWQGPRLIGQAQIITHGSRKRLAEAAYWLSREARGQGYGTEAMAALIESAKTHWPLERIEATVVPGNSGSISVLQRLGFEDAGQALVPYDLPTQWPFGLDRLHRRRGRACLLIFALCLTHQDDE